MSDVLQVIWQISWQAALVAGVVWTISRLAGKAPAAWRHALWVVVLVKLFVPPFAYVPEQFAFWQSTRPALVAPAPTTSPATETTTPVSEAVPAAPVMKESTVTAEESSSSSAGISRISIPSILTSIWVLGICAMSVILLIRISRQKRLLTDASPVDGDLNTLMQECASRLGVRRMPAVFFSERASTPMLVGLLRPTVLLPPGIEGSCTRTDLTAMFMHELAHVKRWDMASVWLHQIAQVLFFFHPSVWLAGREMRRERELACDEMVLSTEAITREEYAAGYVSALKLANTAMKPSTTLAMAEPFDLEMRRLNMILRNAVPRMSKAWVGALVLMVVAGLTTFAGIGSGSSELDGMPSAEFLSAGMRDQEKPGMAIKVTYAYTEDVEYAKGVKVERRLSAVTRRGVYVRTPDIVALEETETFVYEDGPANHRATNSSFNRATGEFHLMDERDTGKSGWISYSEPLIASSRMTWFDPLLHSAETPVSLFVEDGTVVGLETVDGKECWKTELWVNKEHKQKNVVCVDPEIGFNPRRIDIISYKDSVESSRIRVEFSDYRQIAEGVWFPMKRSSGRIEGGKTVNWREFEVESVQYCTAPSAQEMTVDFPSGTRVDLVDGSRVIMMPDGTRVFIMP